MTGLLQKAALSISIIPDEVVGEIDLQLVLEISTSDHRIASKVMRLSQEGMIEYCQHGVVPWLVMDVENLLKVLFVFAPGRMVDEPREAVSNGTASIVATRTSTLQAPGLEQFSFRTRQKTLLDSKRVNVL